MTVELTLTPLTTTPTTSQMWRYRWDITLTWRSYEDAPGAWSGESHIVARTADELCDIVRRTSYDPRVIGSRYQRHAELDMSSAPDTCPSCAEPYETLPPRQRWRHCPCGGHMVYECIVCGHNQLYPQPELSCLSTPDQTISPGLPGRP